MSRWKKFLLLLRPSNGPAAVRILVVLLSVPLRLHRHSLPDLLRSFDREGNKDGVLAGEDRARAELYRDFLNFILVGCLKVKRPCLFRSIALFSHYRRRGIPVQIVYGIRNSGGVLEGHSWLLLDGAPFLETADPFGTYSPLYVYP